MMNGSHDKITVTLSISVGTIINIIQLVSDTQKIVLGNRKAKGRDKKSATSRARF